jgi:hypothetical protein
MADDGSAVQRLASLSEEQRRKVMDRFAVLRPTSRTASHSCALLLEMPESHFGRPNGGSRVTARMVLSGWRVPLAMMPVSTACRPNSSRSSKV